MAHETLDRDEGEELAVDFTDNQAADEKRDETLARRVDESQKPLLALIDSRSLTRESLLQLLENSLNPFQVLPVSSAQDLVGSEKAKRSEIALMLLSIGSMSVSSEEVRTDIGLLRENFPDSLLILLCDLINPNDVAKALREGVQGYISTSMTSAVVVEALRLVLVGGTFIPADVLIDDPLICRRPGESSIEQDQRLRDRTGLTPRQQQVAAVLQQGKPNKIIAYELGMQESTVKVHIRQIMKKLKATNRTQAAILVGRLSEETSG